jgi:ribosomal protein L11 methyltransferase
VIDQHWIKITSMVFLHHPDVVPSDVPAHAILLPQNHSQVFGNGTHPTTRLSAQAVDYWCRIYKPGSLLDVGTGTGILARLARAHGVPFIAATDIDPVALQAARENDLLDHALVPITIVGAAPDFWGSRFELVIANILEATLCDLAPALVAALAPGGTLLISGFTPLQLPALKTVFTRGGVMFEQDARLDEWALLRFSRASEE